MSHLYDPAGDPKLWKYNHIADLADKQELKKYIAKYNISTIC